MKVFFIALLLAGTSTMAQNIPSMNAASEKVKTDRIFFDRLGELYPPAAQVSIRKEKLAGITCHWFHPESSKHDRIILYVHGGSFAFGSIHSHKAMVSHLSKNLSSAILFISYSLAPEKPFPHGVNDVVAVYLSVRERYPKAQIIWMGDSAGGGILVSGLHKLQQQSAALADKVVMISPWLDLRCQNASYQSNKHTDHILTQETLKEYAAIYSPDRVAAANPGQLSFTRFPSTLLLVGSNEILLDDSKNFRNYLQGIQPQIQYEEFEQEQHVWLLTNIHSKGAKKAIEIIKEFLN